MNSRFKKSFLFLLMTFLLLSSTGCDGSGRITNAINLIQNNILEEISDYRSGEDYGIYIRIDDLKVEPSKVLEDQRFIDFLSVQVSDMIDNGEYRLLCCFLDELEDKQIFVSNIQSDAAKALNSIGLKAAFDIKWVFDELDYYADSIDFDFSRNSKLITTYLETNGIKEITTTPGTGFYANKKDSSSRNTVGLPTSPLYDAESITYKGDFKIKKTYGVRLNEFYQESSYSSTSYYFLDNFLTVSPSAENMISHNVGELVYSGDYLLFFASDGTLIDYDEIK